MDTLQPTYFLDSDHPEVIAYALEVTKNRHTPTEKAITLFEAVRDGFWYNPFYLDLRKEAMVASNILKKDSGYCGEKAILLAATLRVVGIPSRLNFGIVKNHIGVESIMKLLGTDKLVFHGCTEVLLHDRWIKITPAFNKELCQKLNVPVLEFDGENDAIFQAYGNDGTIFMEYLHDYGSFDDMPYGLMLSELERHYPNIPIPEDKVLKLV